MKRLVEMHSGSVTAHSEGPGRGATFRVSLPIHKPEAKTAGKSLAMPRGQAGRRILLVEDNGDTAITVTMLLKSLGYQVETAGDVFQALEAVSGREFDLVISDLGLPDRSGIELMQEIRQRGYRLRGIALTGYGSEEDVQRSREAGFTVHLTKPIDLDALTEAIEQVL